MIDLEPIFPDVSDRFREFLEVDRFDNVTVGAHLVSAHDVALLGRRRENNHGNPACARIALDAFKDFVTIQSGQFQVQQYEFRPILNAATSMWSGAEQELERLHPIARNVNWIRKIGGL